MKGSVINKANELLLRMIDAANGAADFAVEKVPAAVEQLLLWKLLESVVLFSVAAIGLCLSVKYFQFAVRRQKEAREAFAARESWTLWRGNTDLTSTAYDLAQGPHHVMAVICGAVALVYMLISLDWVKILVAPDLYLLEYAAKLVQ